MRAKLDSVPKVLYGPLVVAKLLLFCSASQLYGADIPRFLLTANHNEQWLWQCLQAVSVQMLDNKAAHSWTAQDCQPQ